MAGTHTDRLRLDRAMTKSLCRAAHARCFIARSIEFAVSCEPATCIAVPGLAQGIEAVS